MNRFKSLAPAILMAAVQDSAGPANVTNEQPYTAANLRADFDIVARAVDTFGKAAIVALEPVGLLNTIQDSGFAIPDEEALQRVQSFCDSMLEAAEAAVRARAQPGIRCLYAAKGGKGASYNVSGTQGIRNLLASDDGCRRAMLKAVKA